MSALYLHMVHRGPTKVFFRAGFPHKFGHFRNAAIKKRDLEARGALRP